MKNNHKNPVKAGKMKHSQIVRPRSIVPNYKMFLDEMYLSVIFINRAFLQLQVLVWHKMTIKRFFIADDQDKRQTWTIKAKQNKTSSFVACL